MVSGGFDTNIIAPKVIIIPTETPITAANANGGEIMLSGGKLYFFSGANWERITSG